VGFCGAGGRLGEARIKRWMMRFPADREHRLEPRRRTGVHIGRAELSVIVSNVSTLPNASGNPVILPSAASS